MTFPEGIRKASDVLSGVITTVHIDNFAGDKGCGLTGKKDLGP